VEPTLDRTDDAILRILQNDARLSNKELAARVHLAPSSCLERVRRLREKKVLRGFHAEVDPGALGIGLQAMIAVRLRQHSRDVFESLRERFLALPEVVSLFHVGGAEDFLVHVAVRDTEHLRTLAWEGFTARPEVAHIETSLIFEHARSTVLPRFSS
jgi:DNA-binding Lrp family transcriptional regulator